MGAAVRQYYTPFLTSGVFSAPRPRDYSVLLRLLDAKPDLVVGATAEFEVFSECPTQDKLAQVGIQCRSFNVMTSTVLAGINVSSLMI